MADVYIPSPFTGDLLKFVTKNVQDIPLSGEGNVLASYIKYKGVTADIIESFDNFIEYGINSVIMATPIVFYTVDLNGNRIPYRDYRVRLVRAVRPITGDDGTALTPEYAHLNEMTMNTELFYSIREYGWQNGQWIETSDSIRFNEQYNDKPFSLGKIPTMARSKYCNTGGRSNRELYEMGECPSWPGGYFITNGEMRNIIIKQKLRNNRFLIYKDKKSDDIAKCTMICNLPSGTTKVSVFRTAANTPICAWIKFMGYQESGGKPKELNMFYMLELMHKYVFPGSTEQTNLAEIVSDIMMYIDSSVQDQARLVVEHTEILYLTEGSNRDARINKFGKSVGLRDENTVVEDYLLRSIKEGLFPQFDAAADIIRGQTDTSILEYKYAQLCYMIAKYIEYLVGYRKEDDRNSLSTNKFDTAGIALTNLFNDVWKGEVTQFINNTEASGKLNSLSIDYVQKTLMSDIVREIENTFETSIRSKTWGYKSSKRTAKRTQMVETLQINTITLQYSEITKIVIPSSKKGKQLEVRENHQSQTGYIDYVDSPESSACGLTKRKAITCYISQERSDRGILKLVYESGLLDMLEIDAEVSPDRPDVLFVNGKLLGRCNGTEFSSYMRDLRRAQTVPFDTMIVFDEKRKEVHISTDGGRCTRPLLIVNQETGLPVMYEQNLFGAPFEVLLEEGAAEYIDAYEQEYLLLSDKLENLVRHKYEAGRLGIERRRYTHVELDPNSQYGFASAEIPLANHNLGTKNCYACNMMKQGIGTVGSNYFNRFDTGSKMLDNPTEPLMESQMNIISGLNQLPSGRNLTVLYMAYNGYNQEDAIIINEGSIRRGVFDYTVYYKYKFISTTNLYTVPLSEEDINNPLYSNLDPKTGIIREGSKVQAGDVLIRVKQAVNTSTGPQVTDADVIVKYGEMGIVTRVSASGKVVKIQIQNRRNIFQIQPDIGIEYRFEGDKFSSRAATKGVEGILIPEDEMPVSSTGLVPDIVINPLGVPTRAPINLLKEMFICTGHALKGRRVNGTTFNSPVQYERETMRYLEEYGYDRLGEHVMLNRKTGQPYQGTFFMGICDYMMLNHHAADKFQGQGKDIRRDISTRQPIKGRRKMGGIRFGEWERDALLAYSLSLIMYDTMTKSSDEYKCVVCKTCSTKTALQPTDITNKRCLQCGSNDVYPTTIGGNFNYFSDLLSGLNVNLKYGISQ